MQSHACTARAYWERVTKLVLRRACTGRAARKRQRAYGSALGAMRTTPTGGRPGAPRRPGAREVSLGEAWTIGSTALGAARRKRRSAAARHN